MPELWMNIDTDLAEVPVNVMSLIDDTDFKARETSITYDQAGMDLVWNFVTMEGAFTQTAVTPTSGGIHDWTNQGDGIYTLEIPASGGTINNDTRGFGWFTGICTGVLAWRGPMIIFRTTEENNALNALAVGAGYIGDYKAGDSLAFTWESGQVTVSGGTIRVYKDANTTEVTVPTGVTETLDFDSLTGRHRVEIELNANVFYTKNSDYSVIRKDVAISGQTITIEIAEFSIENRTRRGFVPGG